MLKVPVAKCRLGPVKYVHFVTTVLNWCIKMDCHPAQGPGIVVLMPVYFWNHLTWVCFHLKTSGFIFLDSRPKLPKHGRNFSLVFQLINFLTIHVPRPMSHIGQGRHRSWMLGNMFTHSPHNEHRPGTTPEPRGLRALIPAPMRSMHIGRRFWKLLEVGEIFVLSSYSFKECWKITCWFVPH